VTRCTKRTYPGQGSARIYARRLSDRYGTDLYPYRCRHCHRWHLTSRAPLIRTVETQAVEAITTTSHGVRRGTRPHPHATVEEIMELAARMRADRR